MDKKVLVVGFNFSYHDEYSGYGRLMNYVKGCRVFDYTDLFDDSDYSFLGAIFRRLYVELLTIIKGASVDVIHYIYPEGTVFISPLVLKYLLRKKIVMTFHLSPSWFTSYPPGDGDLRKAVRQIFQRLAHRSVKACDHGISLSTESASVYAASYGLPAVSVIPHGIVVDAGGAMAVDKLTRHSICIVGRNYRDWDFVNAVLAQPEARQYEFCLVGVDFEKINDHPGVRINSCRDRLSHAQYVEVLGRCLIMFLPLKYATANNAILEAYQHRVFVLTTRAGLNEDYQEKSLFEVSSPQHFFEMVRWLQTGAGGTDINLVLDQVQISTTKRFGWDGVVEQLKSVYEIV